MPTSSSPAISSGIPSRAHPRHVPGSRHFVAFGRPKGYRGSYKQWEEGNIAPRCVFEVLSPGNRKPEMDRKFEFYETYGVEEYYVYDPDSIKLSAG